MVGLRDVYDCHSINIDAYKSMTKKELNIFMQFFSNKVTKIHINFTRMAALMAASMAALMAA